MTGRILCSLVALALSACGTNQKPAESANTARATEKPAPKPLTMAEEKTPQRGIVQIDDQIRKACGISDEDAYFAFDSSHLSRDDHGVLQRVAKCFGSGPLKGHNMRLIGHADPRGDSDYNMVLGGSRADTVKAFMVAQGVHGPKVATSSRGALDASGTDEASWAKDRRVDIMLAN